MTASSPAKRKRKSVPLRAQLHAALYQLGFEPHAVELDHTPALALREWDEQSGDTRPPANDPKCLIWRPIPEHRLKTTGRKGSSDLSITFDGDISRAAKTKRLTKAEAEFRQRLLVKADQTVIGLDGVTEHIGPMRRRKWPKGRKLRSRGFRKRI